MTLLTAHELQKQFGSRAVLDHASLALDEGEHVGIVGVNGSGKSTLLKILAGLDWSEGGVIALKRGAVVGYLAQEPSLDETHTIRQEMEQALTHHREALHAWQEVTQRLADAQEEEDVEGLLFRMESLQLRIDELGGFDLGHRIASTLTPLGITELDRPIAGLSGGERKRVAIGKVLLQQPELLLLDEPTNHLDADTVLWLEDQLARFRGSILLVTHDRYFLDHVVTRIIEVQDGKLNSFVGKYQDWLETKAMLAAHADRAEQNRQNLMRTELEWLRRGPKARTTKSQARIDRAQALIEQDGPRRSEAARMDFGEAVRQGHTILRLEKVGKRFGTRTLLKDVSLDLVKGERIGIIGPNGAGKTTLLKLIIGQLTPDAGVVTLGKNSVVLYFDQTREQLDPQKTVREEVADQGDYVEIGGRKVHVVTYLEEFLFPHETHRMPIKALSGGERNRVLLAKLMKRRCNLLILDEPTNDLDLITLQVLEAAIQRFDGCVLTVTHDRFFLDKIATAVLAFEGDGKVTKYDGDYETYRRLRAQIEEKEKTQEKARAAAEAARQAKLSPKTEPDASRRPKKLSYAEEKELNSLPSQIEKAEREQSSLQAQLGDSSLYTQPTRLREVQTRLKALEGQLGELYARWEALEEKREAAKAGG